MSNNNNNGVTKPLLASHATIGINDSHSHAHHHDGDHHHGHGHDGDHNDDGNNEGNDYGSFEKTSIDHSSSNSGHAQQTSLQAFSTTLKAISGSGINALPYAMYRAGWAGGLLGMMVVSLLSGWTMRQMLLCVELVNQKLNRESLTSSSAPSDAAGVSSSLSSLSRRAVNNVWKGPIGFREIAHATFPSWAPLLVDITLMSCQIGANCAFIAFISSNLTSVLLHYQFDINHLHVIWGVFPFLVLLSLLRNTTYLAPTSHLGNIALIIGVCTVFAFGYTHTPSPSLTSLPAFKGMDGLCVFLGIAAFALSAHAEVTAINGDVKDRTGYLSVLNWTMVAVTALYTIFAAFAYACFGENTASNIFLNLGDSIFVVIVKICMSVVVMFNYPLTLFPAMQTLDSMVFGSTFASEESSAGTWSSLWWKGSFLRIAAVAFTCVAASLLDDFGLLTALVGSLSGGVLCFWLPPLFYWKLRANELTSIEWLVLLVQVILGLLLFASGLAVAFS